MPRLALLFAMPLAIFLSGCASPSYQYRFIPGRTATVQDGIATAPASAPPAVQAAVAAGNRIAGLPYEYGGGHGSGIDSGYDCSGATSYLLRAAGRLDSPMPSTGFRRYGSSGEGKWISIYARKGHVFLVVAGVRFDTGWGAGSHGPRWTTANRPAKGAVIRHPTGL